MPTVLEHRASSEALRAEHQQNWRNARAFVRGAHEVEIFEKVTFAIVHEGTDERLEVPAEVVMVSTDGPLLGVGLEFVDRTEQTKNAIAAFLDSLTGAQPAQPELTEAPVPPPLTTDLAEKDPAEIELPLPDAAHEDLDFEMPGAYDEGESLDALGEAEDLPSEDEAAPSEKPVDDLYLPDHKVPASVHERVRKMSFAEQIKLARTGELNERIVIERICGKAVWEALLANPRISAPEVARIAKMGSAPRPIIEHIVGNNAWVQSGPVKRALLTNPRLSEDAALKILRTMTKNELKIAERSRAYTLVVRTAAKKLTTRD